MSQVKSQVRIISKEKEHLKNMADIEIKMKDRSASARSRSPRRSRSHSIPSRSLSPSRSRSRSREHGHGHHGGREHRPARDRYDGPADEKLALYIRGLLEEKEDLDPKKYPYIHRLIASGKFGDIVYYINS